MEPAVLQYDPQRPVIEAIQDGDADAMAEFMASQARWIRGVAFGVLGRTGDLDDVCQKVWIKVWQEAGTLKDSAVWRPWLYRITRNAAMDALRAGQRRKRLHETSSELEASEPAGRSGPQPPYRELVVREDQRVMLDAIESLPALYREPFVLKHVEDWSYAQIGEALGLPVDTVETRLVRARRLLREKLAGKV